MTENQLPSMQMCSPRSFNYLNPDLQVGIGAFVLNEAQEVLVVQERRGPLRGKVKA